MARLLTVDFVTSNAGKCREARQILRPYGIGVRQLALDVPEVQELDIVSVTRQKAADAFRLSGKRHRVVVEDSGLFIRALCGCPGTYSKHAVKTIGIPGIIRALDGGPRYAEFRTTVAILGPEDREASRVFSGRCAGAISLKPKGAATADLPYDPVFVPDGYGKTFAQLPAATKNELSARGKAFRKLGQYLARESRGVGRP